MAHIMVRDIIKYDCEKCHKTVTKFGAQMCCGLLCTKIYCHSCFQVNLTNVVAVNKV